MHTIIAAACSLVSLLPIGQRDERTTALDKAQAAWQAHKPQSYEFTLSKRCFCLWAKTPPTFRVTNDTPVPVGTVDNRFLSDYQRYDTVEKLFGVIKDAIAHHPDMMTVVYDDALGYPISVDIDYRKDMFDDEVSLRVSDFKTLRAALR